MTDTPEPHRTLRDRALAALRETVPARKVAAARALGSASHPWAMPTGASLDLLEPDGLPGRPPLPRRVPHTALQPRSPATPAGRAALIHAIAHIEFNAIDLALDAIWRFADLPDDYYRDWARVAGEEATHFILLQDHLATLGFAYGDFDAHDGLWDMARRTRDDVVARLGLVPRTLEARGLDASPPLRRKLAAAGDQAAAAILDRILADEIGHVAIGNRWYAHVCAERGLDPVATFDDLAERYSAPRPRPPLNLAARRAAGFSEAELDAIVRSTVRRP